MKIYNKIQTKFIQQQNKLIARQFIGKDLIIYAQGITVDSSNALIMHTKQNNIIYYVRESIIQQFSETTKYALYRDDTITQAHAITENVRALTIQILPLLGNRQFVKITVEFDYNDIMEIACILPH